MGGRGSGSGFSNVSLAFLVQAVRNAQGKTGANWQHTGDYTDGNNPALVKYQGQEDDKTANFLAGTDRKTDFADYDDGYQFHDIPLNKLLLRLGIKGKPTTLSDKDFDAYVQQTGQQVFYRGWSGKEAAERMMDAEYNHVGNGRYGDGYYFTPDRSVAQSFAWNVRGSGVVTRMALSPTARVISLSELRQKMASMSTKLQSSMRYAGTGGSGRTFSPNMGESQAALKLGYNVIDTGSGYLHAVTRDAFIVSRKLTK